MCVRLESRSRIGIEAAYLPVARFNAISAALAARATGPNAPALVATERLVERSRMVKDPLEIETLREAGRRLGRIGAVAAGFVTRRQDRAGSGGRP